MFGEYEEPDAIYGVDRPAEITILRHGICCCRIRSGKKLIEFRADVEVLLASMGNGARAYATHVGSRAAKIVALPRR